MKDGGFQHCEPQPTRITPFLRQFKPSQRHTHLQLPYFTRETINYQHIVTSTDGKRLATEFLFNLACLLSCLSVYSYMRGISGDGMYMLARRNRSSLATGQIQKWLPTLLPVPYIFSYMWGWNSLKCSDLHKHLVLHNEQNRQPRQHELLTWVSVLHSWRDRSPKMNTHTFKYTHPHVFLHLSLSSVFWNVLCVCPYIKVHVVLDPVDFHFIDKNTFKKYFISCSTEEKFMTAGKRWQF